MVAVKEDMKGAARRERRPEDKRISITAAFRRRLSAASSIGFKTDVLCARATGEGVRVVLWLAPLPHGEINSCQLKGKAAPATAHQALARNCL